MTANTPTPYTPPDGAILTTMAEARRIGHGQIMAAYDRSSEWHQLEKIEATLARLDGDT